MSSRTRSPRRRRRSSAFRNKNAPKLFDYFVAVGLKQTDFNAPTEIEFLPNSKDVGWAPHVLYSYNSNKIVSATTTASSSTTTSSHAASPRAIPKLQERYSQLPITKEEITEELELMEQIKKFSFCDLSDLVNKYNKLSAKDKEARKYYKILSFKHGLQSERFTFCVTKSSGTRLYGHCCRLFTPDVNLKPSEMPTALVLISSHPFHMLFDQIMDHIVVRWFTCHQAVFPILDALILNQPPALGDTFRVTIKSQVSKDDEVLTFKLNSTYHISLKRLFQTLSVNSILWLVSCILTERRVIFYCNSLETLSECIHGLLALIYPFRWQHIFVPVLPESLINYLAAPVPFIIGIKSYLAQMQTEFPISEVVLVDLDKQSVRSTKELQNKLKPLPTDPVWKLKRELKRCLKRYPLALQTYEDYRSKYGAYNPKSYKIPKFSMNVQEQAKGWDDVAFYDAFLAFFVLLIGDWRNFYDESNKNVPRPPYHLGAEQKEDGAAGGGSDSSAELTQSTTAISQTPPAVDNDAHAANIYDGADADGGSGGGGQTDNIGSQPSTDNNNNHRNSKQFPFKNVRKLAGQVKKVGGFASNKLKKTIQVQAKKREVKKEDKMYYNAEAMEYIELLCQSQLFQTWFIRQQKEASDSVKRVSGIQDRYDYVMQNFNRIGASYTGCYKYLCQDSKYRNANHHLHGNLKLVIELAISFTSNRDYSALMQQQQSIQLTLNKLAQEAKTPMGYDAVRNVVLCRLNDCFGKNNHPHGLMALYLLANLMEHSTDRILMECMNNFVFYANVLTKYQHEKMLIAKQMNKIALEVIKLSTRLEEIKKKKIDKYVAFGDDYEYKYDESKYQKQSMNRSKKDGKSENTDAFIDDKIAQIDFANIYDNKQDQCLLGSLFNSNTNDTATHMFTEVSQFRADNVQHYRERCMRGEVRMIPPFEHLRNEFGEQMPDELFFTNDGDDILAFFEDEELRQRQDAMQSDTKHRASDKASDFALSMLQSFSPPMNAVKKPSSAEALPQLEQQVSIFDLGQNVNENNMIASSVSLYSDGDPQNGYDTQGTPVTDASDDGGFLSRTDTNFKRTTNQDVKEWVTFDDALAENETQNTNHNDNPFREGNVSAIDQIMFANGDKTSTTATTTQQRASSKKKRISIGRGLGNVLNKVKETGKKVKRKSSKQMDDIFIAAAPPSKMKQKNATSKDFDALNFNNVQAASDNNEKAKSLFAGFDFNQDATANANNTSNANNSNNAFDDLFSDFAASNDTIVSQPQLKPSVKDMMQHAYKKEPNKNATDVFADLF